MTLRIAREHEAGTDGWRGRHEVRQPGVDLGFGGVVRLMMADEQSAWQPIETAPKDGTRIDVWSGHRQADVCWLDCVWEYRNSKPFQGWFWTNDDGEPILVEDVTHWMPLPAPPTPP